MKKSFYVAAIFVIPFLNGCTTVLTEADVMAMTQICGQPESSDTEPAVRLYGGKRGDGFTSGRSLVSDRSGGYIIAGVTQGLGSYAGNTDLLLARIHETGTIQWASVFGGPQMDIGTAFIRTADSGHIQAGDSYGHLHTGMAYVVAGSDMQRLLLLKTNSFGNYEWHKLYLTRFEENGRGSNMYSVLQSPDGGYLVSGSVAMNPSGPEGPKGLWSDVLIAKTDADGNALWGYSYGGPGPDEAFASLQAIDGGYTLAGTYSTSGDRGAFDVLLLKVDKEGKQQWAKTFGGSGRSLAKSVVRTVDNGYAIVAETDAFGAGGKDILLIKTDQAGVIEWAHTYGEAGDESVSEAVQTSDGGLLLTGYISGLGDEKKDALIMKTDSSGKVLWVSSFGEAGDDIAVSAVENDEGSYTVVGTTESYAASNRDIFMLHIIDPSDRGVCLEPISLSQKPARLGSKDVTLIQGDIELFYQQDSLRKQRPVSIQ